MAHRERRRERSFYVGADVGVDRQRHGHGGAGAISAERAEEGADLLGQELGLLHGAEVPAPRHLEEAAKVAIRALDPLAGQADDSGFESIPDGTSRRSSQTAGLPAVPSAQSS
jgi:hypothetical protein